MAPPTAPGAPTPAPVSLRGGVSGMVLPAMTGLSGTAGSIPAGSGRSPPRRSSGGRSRDRFPGSKSGLRPASAAHRGQQLLLILGEVPADAERDVDELPRCRRAVAVA